LDGGSQFGQCSNDMKLLSDLTSTYQGEQPDIEGEVTSLDSTLINSRGFHDLGDLQNDLDGPFDDIHLPMIDEAWDRLAHDMSCSYNGVGTVTSATSYGDAVAQCFDITWQGPLPLAGDAIPSWSSHDPCACSQDVHQAIAQQGVILDLVYEELRQAIPSDQDYNSTWLEDVDPDPVRFYEDPCWRTLVADTDMTAQSQREPLGDYLAFEDAIGARF
jgi:hypothetical protein